MSLTKDVEDTHLTDLTGDGTVEVIVGVMVWMVRQEKCHY